MTISKKERGPSEPRTLQSIKEDHAKYVADGSRRARAKDVSHSIVAQPFVDIEINHVSLTDTCDYHVISTFKIYK